MRIEQKALARAQRVLKTMIVPRPVRPVLGSVLVRGGYAIATDLRHTLRVALAPGQQTEPEFLVPWATFKTLKGAVDIAPLPEDPERPRVRVGAVTLESFPLREFPAVPAEPPTHLQTLNMEHLLRHLRRCEVTRAHGETARALLTGVGVFEDGGLVATDGFHVYAADAGPCYEGRALARAAGGNAVLPGEACRVLAAFAWDHASMGAERTPGTDAPRWCFCSDGEAAWLRGLEGRYFAVRELIPTTYPHTLTLERRALLRLCEQAAAVATEAPHPVLVDLGHGTLRVRARQDGNAFDTTVTAETSGTPFTLGYNAKHLLAGLGKVAEGVATVTLECSGVHTLSRVAVPGGAYTLMPLQLPEEDREAPPAPAPSAEAAQTAGAVPRAAPEAVAPEPTPETSTEWPTSEPAPEPAPQPAPDAEVPAAEGVPLEAPAAGRVPPVPAPEEPAPDASPEAATPETTEAPEPEGVPAAAGGLPDEVAAVLQRAQEAVACAHALLTRLLASA